jgi:hypothetical protein
MALAIDVADAVVAELAGGTFSQAFTPERRVLPSFDLKDLATLRVTVAPNAVEVTGGTRSVSQYDCRVDVGIQKRLGRDLDAEVTHLCDLVEEIADYLRKRTLAKAPHALWMRTVNEPIYAPEHLLEHRTFTSVLTLTYRAFA